MSPHAWLMVGATLAVAAAGALAGCASIGDSIAGDVARALQMLEDQPLSVRCQAVEDAQARCRAAGLPPDCGWDGWNDQDRDAWTIGACEERTP